MTHKPGAPRERATARSAEEALHRARDHARTALAEALAAARCVLDAAALATAGHPAAEHDTLARIDAWLEQAAAGLGGDAGSRWLGGVSEALDAEIARWEERSREDPEARAVLRAFLGVREVLWEFGLRSPRTGDGANEPEQESAPRRRVRRSRGDRPLERVPIEG
ncbi:MAG: hypothetical protein QNK03_23125 [Myxococcota bacterium]|nr:hypothetical protein [Myxococcota bacterium]